jgi:hypothetical protein
LKAEHAKWLEKKGEFIYDFEDNTLDFGRSKPTRWKGNKRISLPKSGSASLEAYFEIRRREASRTFDECLKILGKGKDTKHDNLDKEEKEGLKSLQERVKSGELIICATDKSGRFAVLTREQYIQAGEAHTKHDKKVGMEESKMIERELNGHMRWWSEMTGLGGHWNQKDRSLRNLLNHGLATCPMTLLIKDHKTWSVESGETPPTRSIMGGNVGGNKGLSEFMSFWSQYLRRWKAWKLMHLELYLTSLGKSIKI